MQLANEFVVPRSVDETWAVLTDVERIAPCMPGATLGEVVDDVYHGTVKVKVGPVTAQYAGTATFRELDRTNHHLVLEATGKESSGRGRASALVTADLAEDGTGTRVKVVTDLTISGPLAQFGRGAIAEISTKLLGQFVTQLEATVLAGGSTAAEPDVLPAAAVAASSAIAPDTTVAASSAAGPDVTIAASSTMGPAATTAASNTTGPDTTVTGPSTTVPAAAAGSEVTMLKPAAPPAAKVATEPAGAEVNLLRVAAWPILKRLVPLIVLIAVVVLLLIWWLG